MYLQSIRIISNTVYDVTISADKAITEGPDTINYRIAKRDGEVQCWPVSHGHGNLPATNGATGAEAIERLFDILDRRAAIAPSTRNGDTAAYIDASKGI